MFTIATVIAARGAKQTQHYNKNQLALLSVPIKRDGSKVSAFSQVMGQDDEPESVIDDIFGPRGKLPADLFVEQFSNARVKWVFSAPVLRKKIFEKADIQMRHFR